MPTTNQQALLKPKPADLFKGWKPLEPPPDLTKHGYYVGTSGYYFEDWLGRFNPPKLSAKNKPYLPEAQQKDQDRLVFYQKYFSFVEINHTFYSEPLLQSFLDIESRSKPGTLYTVKVHKKISHRRQWDVQEGCAMMKKHLQAVGPLIETGRFYSFLIQLEDTNDRSMEKLDYLLAVSEIAVQKKADVHIEFRHQSWHHEYAIQKLKDYGIGICNTEIPPLAHVFPLKAYATTNKGYIRYSGLNTENWVPKQKAETARERTAQRNRRYDYLYSLSQISDRVKGQQILAKKTMTVAIAFNNHFKIQGVLNAIQNLKQLHLNYS